MLAEIETYSPYEKMNMLRTGARVRRLKTLYNLKTRGITEAKINGKIETIDKIIKRTKRQSTFRDMFEAQEVKV